MSTNFSTIFNKARKWIFQVIKNNAYTVVKDAAGKAAFGIIGGTNILHRYKNLYIGKDNEVNISRKINLDTAKTAERLVAATGMVVMRNAGLIKGLEDRVLMVPGFIELTIKLPPSFDDYCASLTGARSDIRKVKKMGYTCTIIDDKAWGKTFYADYYVPSMQNRHAEEAYIMSESDLLKLIQRPGAEFVNVYLGGQHVASALTQFKNGKYKFLRVGWLQGNNIHVDAGATGAIYWNLIKRAYELNCNELMLGGAPAYLENGVLQYKAKWQGRFWKEKFYRNNYLLLNPADPYCYRFLKETSLVAYSPQNALMVLSNKKPDEVKMPGVLLNDIDSWYILRTGKAMQCPENVEELPVDLRYWYERVYK